MLDNLTERGDALLTQKGKRPKSNKECVAIAEAEEIKTQLEEAGATVELK